MREPNSIQRRRGQVAFEAAMSLAVTFTMAFAALAIAARSIRNLYHVIATLIGSPYL